MSDPISEVLNCLRAQGVIFEMEGDRVRWRAPRGMITTEQRRLLAENLPIVEAILKPSDTLTDEIIIPASCPNTIDAIEACIDRQRRRRVA